MLFFNKFNFVRFFKTLLVAFCLLLFYFESEAQEPQIRKIQTKIAMPDGANLLTDIYLPEKDGQYPAVIIRTPYGGNSQRVIGEKFAEAGYAVVVQNVRGMGGSEGRFIPFISEKNDGIVTLDWVCRQPWNNSKAGFWGVSYLAYAGLQMASGGNNSCLSAGINISGWTDLNSFLYQGGAFRLGDQLPWLIFQATGKAANEERMNKIFQTLPLQDAFGKQFSQRSSVISGDNFAYQKINIPILHITGWFDYIYRDTLSTYENILRKSSKAKCQKLLIGHWAHNEIYQKTTIAGDEDFGAEAAMGYEKLLTLSLRWFDYYLKGIDNGLLKESKVKYFVMGENRWHETDKWIPENIHYEKWYLNGEQVSGKLSRKVQGKTETSSFIFNPINPVPTVGGANSPFLPWLIGVKNQQFIEKRDDVLIFDSAPIEKAITLVGPIQAVIYASTEGSETDFTAKLVEVRPDGYARLIESGIKRGKNPEDVKTSSEKAKQVYRYEIQMGATAIKLQKGSRLRLEVSSSNFPKYDRNPNTGENPLTATIFKTVRQTVFHSKQYPSYLMLPIQ